ncbi:MAG: hypothetical protein KA715_12870 [Xanthomonadaceae bacterium]|nr:hypothetical protein [Xanthomonadaceae bacterium]
MNRNFLLVLMSITASAFAQEPFNALSSYNNETHPILLTIELQETKSWKETNSTTIANIYADESEEEVAHKLLFHKKHNLIENKLSKYPVYESIKSIMVNAREEIYRTMPQSITRKTISEHGTEYPVIIADFNLLENKVRLYLSSSSNYNVEFDRMLQIRRDRMNVLAGTNFRMAPPTPGVPPIEKINLNETLTTEDKTKITKQLIDAIHSAFSITINTFEFNEKLRTTIDLFS